MIAPATPAGSLAVADRSDLIEEYHDGAVAVADPSGTIVAASGDIDRSFYFRSAAKPFQAAASLEAGAPLNPVQLAVAAASHSGDPVHVALVRSILAEAGLSEADLGCPPARPFAAADRRLAAGGDVEAARRFHNCSGKHSAMLAACVASEWETGTYLDADHPLQQRIGRLVAEVSGVEVGPPGVDGCGAPVWRTSVAGMARAFSRLENDERFAAVRRSMGQYPLLVSGMGRGDGMIGQWLGAAAKGGAAGCMGLAAAGHGIAAKAWTGSSEVAGAGVGLGLEHLGLITRSVADGLADVLSPPVWGGGKVMGRIRPVTVLDSV